MEIRYEDLNHMTMWNILRRGGEIRLVVNNELAKGIDYLIEQYDARSSVNLSTGIEGLIFLVGFFLNIRTVFTLWFKYPKFFQIDQLRCLYKELKIVKISEGEEVCYLLK